MKLYYTPRSHFSRKVRILADALKLDMELIDIGDVASEPAEHFGPNPLMQVPTLVDKGNPVFESDYIAQYLVRQFDRDDQFNVLINDIELLNTRAVMNGVMSADVELVLAVRTGMDTQAHRRFDRIRESITNGLHWLETHAELLPDPPSYSGFHLVSMWDHLVLCNLVPLNYPKLLDKVEQLSSLSYVAASSPR